MNRPQQIRAVFQELRRTVGDRFTARELLEQAAALVELFTVPEDHSRFELRTGGVPFEEWSLDVAMADGGWRLAYPELRISPNPGPPPQGR
ncbi:MAG TPA: hypothetical protein PK959_14750 [Candidatus Competibacteraceae bacterium]|nr:hypothetical protein [Candidatus Competibacteraceae bacterium]HSA47894.1 hypothetical protein [Candidatus Competibacteraceae bacterium]